MRKKSEFTIVERALQTVEGFSLVFSSMNRELFRTYLEIVS